MGPGGCVGQKSIIGVVNELCNPLRHGVWLWSAWRGLPWSAPVRLPGYPQRWPRRHSAGCLWRDSGKPNDRSFMVPQTDD